MSKSLVSGLVITLRGEEEQRQATRAAINSHGAFEIGEVSERWLPVVVEAADDAESRALHDWLMSLPGVSFVDVVAVNFEEPETRFQLTFR